MDNRYSVASRLAGATDEERGKVEMMMTGEILEAKPEGAKDVARLLRKVCAELSRDYRLDENPKLIFCPALGKDTHPNDEALCLHVAERLMLYPSEEVWDKIDAALRSYVRECAQRDDHRAKWTFKPFARARDKGRDMDR